jgi:hypothetical protein
MNEVAVLRPRVRRAVGSSVDVTVAGEAGVLTVGRDQHGGAAPGNTAALAAWRRLGFRNLPGDYTVGGTQVIANYKGPGRDRPFFELDLTTTAPAAHPDDADAGSAS